MDLVLASPTYGPVQPRAVRAIRMACMYAAAHGVRWVGESSPDRMTVINARNSAVNLALGVGADGVMWIDYDMVPEMGDITRLLGHKKQFVSGLYRNRSQPQGYITARWDALMEEFIPHSVVNRGLVPMDAAGFGFMFTARELLRALPKPHFGRFGSGSYAGEDLYFCHKAMTMFPRTQLYVDTDMAIGHLGEPEVIR
jgi:hypothetical protein